MSQNSEIKRLLEAEITLRPTTPGDREALQAWVDSVAALRKGIPDWSVTMLGLLNELEAAEAKEASHG
ncbi:hypothetical protein D3C77_311220 [compost metagenome]